MVAVGAGVGVGVARISVTDAVGTAAAPTVRTSILCSPGVSNRSGSSQRPSLPALVTATTTSSLKICRDAPGALVPRRITWPAGNVPVKAVVSMTGGTGVAVAVGAGVRAGAGVLVAVAVGVATTRLADVVGMLAAPKGRTSILCWPGCSKLRGNCHWPALFTVVTPAITLSTKICSVVLGSPVPLRTICPVTIVPVRVLGSMSSGTTVAVSGFVTVGIFVGLCVGTLVAVFVGATVAVTVAVGVATASITDADNTPVALRVRTSILCSPAWSKLRGNCHWPA